MGLGGISVWQLFIILIIFVLTLLAAPISHRGGSAGPGDASGKQDGNQAGDEEDRSEG